MELQIDWTIVTLTLIAVGAWVITRLKSKPNNKETVGLLEMLFMTVAAKAVRLQGLKVTDLHPLVKKALEETAMLAVFEADGATMTNSLSEEELDKIKELKHSDRTDYINELKKGYAVSVAMGLLESRGIKVSEDDILLVAAYVEKAYRLWQETSQEDFEAYLRV